MKYTIFDALLHFECAGITWKDTYESIESPFGTPIPSKSDLIAKADELNAEEPMRLLRLQRDQLLSATDWWCVSDRTATQAQLDYRQALRDLPANCTPALDENGQLTGVEWPVKPQ